jgi:predicted nucleic acid-binding protein
MNEGMRGVRRVFLDSAPVIYFVERHPVYYSVLQPVFNRFESRDLTAVTSPITLAECLIFPMRSRNYEAAEAFVEILGGGGSAVFVPLQKETAKTAAEIRSKYNVTLADAFQIASALEGSCDVLLTNDKALTRITELRVLLVESLQEAHT